ncbi:ABC transporter permease [Bacillus sp. HMF5848]|uniref:ABC transporter permease n=1 Tax=Bacillus sp. HMF5848 TaxID=2495421 RepID=UPI000F76DE54|nr:ABC transporter permease [Bacillus sp. HMF5848]RSK26730.1 ABC transporter permease [Bacillus sp. HMF5848]
MRIIALVIRIIRQFFRDRRTLGLMIVAPMFVLLLMNIVFNGKDYVPTIAYDNMPASIIDSLESSDAKVVEMSEEEALDELQAQRADGYIKMDGMVPSIILEGSDPTANMAVITAVTTALKKLSSQANLMEPEIELLHGYENMSLIDNFGPILIGFFIFFFVFLISGVSFLRERTSGTLERLLATPLRRWEIVVGYILGFGIFAVFQATLISWFAIEVLDIMMTGSFGFILLVTFLLALTALSLGTLLSAFAGNELQMMQFIPIVVIPQIFFSGIINLETMDQWLRTVSYFMPLTYGADALRHIMIRGQGWDAIATDVYYLLGFALLFMLLNVVALRKHRRL